jgi:cephalosporin-C deacetylase-like acetyl esterase
MKYSIRGFLLFLAVIMLDSCSPEVKTETASNNIRTYLIRAASEITDQSLSEAETLPLWKEMLPSRRKEFAEMMGISDLPGEGQRSPLHVKVTGTLQMDGYRIEKLYYESLPGLYVAANLYIPDNIKEPRPAILYVCGHSPTQKGHYQAHPRKFAQLGFVCLIIETIQYGEVCGDHWGCYAKGWFNWYSRGYNPGAVELWNGVRGLDLLVSRPEVDPGKLGVTGISGGGAQSWYIGAFDERVRAVAPVCGASTLKTQVTARTIDGHCDCMMPVNSCLWDFTDIGALIAPRPLLIGQADRDGLNQIESVRELYTRIGKIYTLYGAADKIGLVESPGGHSYHRISRESIFAFFLQHLMGKNMTAEEAGDIDESEDSQISDEDLRVYIDGPPSDDRTTTIQDSFITLQRAPEISSVSDLNLFRDTVRNYLLARTFMAFPRSRPAFGKILEFRTLDNGKFGEDIYSFDAETGWRLKVDFHWEHPADSLSPLVLVLRNMDEERWASENFSYSVAESRNVAYFEARGVGEAGWAPGLQWHVRRASAWTGRTIASMQVYDVLRCLEFCRTIPGVDPARISIAARDEMGVVALYAALLDGKCQSVILKNPPATQDQPGSPDGRGPALEMLNCLRITDIYEIPALITPTRLYVVGNIPPSFQWSENVLEKLGLEPFTLLASGE